MRKDAIRDSKSSPADPTIEREIEEMLAVDPPQHFAARVHARIAETPASSPWILRRIVAGSGAVALAIVLIFVASRPHETALQTVSVTPSAAFANSNVELRPQMKTPDARLSFPAGVRFKEPEVLFSAADTAALQRLLVVTSVTSVDLSPAIAIDPQHLPEFHITPIADLVPLAIDPFPLANNDRGVLQ